MLPQRLQRNRTELDGCAFALQPDMAFVRHPGRGFVLELAINIDLNIFSSARDSIAVPFASLFLAVLVLSFKKAELLLSLGVLD